MVNGSEAVAGKRLYQSNKVTAGAKSQVVVRYSNNCEVVVEARKSLVIGKAPDCRQSRRKPHENSMDTTIPESAEVTESTASTAGTAGTAGAAGMVGTTSFIIPGVILAGFGGAIAISHNDHEDREASPK